MKIPFGIVADVQFDLFSEVENKEQSMEKDVRTVYISSSEIEKIAKRLAGRKLFRNVTIFRKSEYYGAQLNLLISWCTCIYLSFFNNFLFFSRILI